MFPCCIVADGMAFARLDEAELGQKTHQPDSFGRDSNVIAVPLVTSLTSGCVIPSSCASRVMPYPRPNMVAVQAYDGMHIIYEALKKTDGSTDGVRLVDAMKGLSFVSPRGPVTVDPQTRELIQNVYIRKVERVDGELYNVEFATIPNFKDPSKLKN